MELNAIVAQRIEVTPSLMILRVVPDGWELSTFKAGQYTVLGLPGSAPRFQYSDEEAEPVDPDKLIRRAYSIASSSKNKEFMEFYITLVRSGALTPRLFALKPGGRVYLSPKVTGMFVLSDVPPDQNIIMISTGTGLAPYMSMLRSQLECNATRRYAVLHGARHSWDLGYRSELIAYEHLCRNFYYLPVISRPNQENTPWGGLTGYVQQIWESGKLAETMGYTPTPEDTHIFLCGNPGMIAQMTKVLEQEGFQVHTKRSPGQVHFEKYW